MGINAMHVVKTGLNAQQVRMQIISNNLANVNTTGFKRDRANFESLLYQVLKTSGAQTTGETRNVSVFNVGTGVIIINRDKLFNIYKKELENLKHDYYVIEGKRRLETVIEKIYQLTTRN